MAADKTQIVRDRSDGWALAIIGLLLLVQFVVGALTASRLTVTHDEYWHIPIGLSHWKTGRFDVEPLNPPLLRMWGTWPLLFTSAHLNVDELPSDAIQIGDRFLAENLERHERFVIFSRLPMVLLTVATGGLLARWAWEWFGPWSAVLVTWLWSRDPTVLAHGSLMTTDLGATSFWVLTFYCARRWSLHPTWSRTLILGVVLGMAQAAKFTCVLLVPLVVVLWCVECFRNKSAWRLNWKQSLKHWGAVTLTACVCLNAAYLFRGTGTPLRDFQFVSESAQTWQKRFGPLAALPVPLPKDYVVGIDRQKAFMEVDHPVFLDMKWWAKRFPYYYLMTLIYKLPHSTQGLLLWVSLAAIFTGVRSFFAREVSSELTVLCARQEGRRRLSWMLIPPTTLVLVASLSGMQLGIRYILPALPFLFLAIGQLASKWVWPQVRWAEGSVILLLFVCDPWHSHPQYLAYFNELSGGMEHGRFHLLDSNLDWGQDLHELRDAVREERIESLKLAYFGTLPPESLGLVYSLPPSRFPQPGWHAVSVNFVLGRPHMLRDGQGGFRNVGLGEFAYFASFEPKRRIGASIDLFHLTEQDIRNWESGSNDGRGKH